MEFKFRSEDEKSSSSYFSPSCSDNYFTEQALRAGFLSNEVRRTDFVMNSDPLREAIERQLEKERIREEIIAAEIIRKRELEAEVRRELAMERDLALRRGEGFSLMASASSPSLWSEPRVSMLPLLDGFSFDERLPQSARREDGVIDKLPFQRHPEMAKVAEVNKGKVGQVMFLAKPTSPNIAGTKRKLAPIGGASELGIAGSKKKPQKEWSCALCQVSATSEQGLNEHIGGKKHKAKEAELRANKTGGKQSGSSSNSLPKKKDKSIKLAKISGSPNQKQGKKQEAKSVQVKKNQKTEDLKKKFKFWCEQCHIGCHSETVMGNHRRGKKHRAQLQAVKQIGGVFPAATATDTFASEGKIEDITEEAKEEVMENVDGEVDGVEEKKEEGEEETKTMESSLAGVAEAEASEELENDTGNSGNHNANTV